MCPCRYVLPDDQFDRSAACSAHLNLSGDQWVATEHLGVRATGRVVSVRRDENGEVLYEVELPLLTSHGAMTRVLRGAGQIQPISGDWSEPRLALRTCAD